MAIAPPPRGTPALWRHLCKLAVQGKRENVPPNLGGDWMRAILSGTPYPLTLLSTAVLRARSDQEVNAQRAAVMKSVLVRNYEMEVPLAPHPELRWRGRSRRPPLDAMNAQLSFLYILLVHDCRSACESVGLDPARGFPASRPTRPAEPCARPDAGPACAPRRSPRPVAGQSPVARRRLTSDGRRRGPARRGRPPPGPDPLAGAQEGGAGASLPGREGAARPRPLTAGASSRAACARRSRRLSTVVPEMMALATHDVSALTSCGPQAPARRGAGLPGLGPAGAVLGPRDRTRSGAMGPAQGPAGGSDRSGDGQPALPPSRRQLDPPGGAWCESGDGSRWAAHSLSAPGLRRANPKRAADSQRVRAAASAALAAAWPDLASAPAPVPAGDGPAD